MTWLVLNIIGTIAFAISGALIAMEEKYDILGVYVLGFTTAFGGGLVRNVLIGIPVQAIWQQNNLFKIAALVIALVFFLPSIWDGRLKKSIVLFDAIGLGAFAIQGANYAVEAGLPIIAAVLAAILTGAGGGMVRDILAGRRPMIFYSEIYGLWAGIAGFIIGLNVIESPYLIYGLLGLVVILRMSSVYFNWNLPKYFDAKTIKPAKFNSPFNTRFNSRFNKRFIKK